jgi:glutamate 5-kinase
MRTKIQAAQLASRSGVTTVIAAGSEPDVLLRLVAGEPLGTRFAPVISHLEGRKRWLLAEQPRGAVRVDAGAADRLRTGGASLLPVGVTAVEGEFERGEPLAVRGPDGVTVAHGLTNYNSDDLRRLRGARSHRIIEILGYSYGDAVIHRNNLVLLV